MNNQISNCYYILLCFTKHVILASCMRNIDYYFSYLLLLPTMFYLTSFFFCSFIFFIFSYVIDIKSYCLFSVKLMSSVLLNLRGMRSLSGTNSDRPCKIQQYIPLLCNCCFVLVPTNGWNFNWNSNAACRV